MQAFILFCLIALFFACVWYLASRIQRTDFAGSINDDDLMPSALSSLDEADLCEEPPAEVATVTRYNKGKKLERAELHYIHKGHRNRKGKNK